MEEAEACTLKVAEAGLQLEEGDTLVVVDDVIITGFSLKSGENG